MYKWSEWDGRDPRGPHELEMGDRVFVRYRDGSQSKVRIVGDLRWDHRNLVDDIVAYRFSHHEPSDGKAT